jgi:hypothetical protein
MYKGPGQNKKRRGDACADRLDLYTRQPNRQGLYRATGVARAECPAPRLFRVLPAALYSTRITFCIVTTLI